MGPQCEKLWPFEFLESFRCLNSSVSIYYKPESYLSVKTYYHLNFWRGSVVHFLASLYEMRMNRTSVWKVMTIWISRELPWFNSEHLDIICARIWTPCGMLWPFEFLECFCCSISSISTYYAPKSDIRVKIYDHLNFRELPLFIFERLYMWCTLIRHPG